MTYSEKLRDPRWQKKRLEILQRDDFKCVYCLDDKHNLHVHHEEYRKGDPWDISNNCLSTVCENCHDFFHIIKFTKTEKYLLDMFLPGMSEHFKKNAFLQMKIRILKFKNGMD